MNYDELIARALKGRSVNSMAKAWGIPQTRLDRYVKGIHMPDYTTGLKLAKEAGVSPGEAFEILASAEEHHKMKNFKLQMGFAQPGWLAAIAAVMLAVSLFLTGGEAKASSHIPYFDGAQSTNLYYVKWHTELSRLLRTIRAWFKWLLGPAALQPAAT